MPSTSLQGGAIEGAIVHGSHPHPLHPVKPSTLVVRSSTSARLCGICQASLEVALAHDAAVTTPSVWRCPSCDFFLCVKCREVDEQPFATPQIVVRNPCLSRSDPSIAVRTRPRSTGYALCPVHCGELIEVVAFAESKEEPGTFFFRQRTGGWVHASHVVCVYPSERSISSLAKLHVQYMQTGAAAPPPHHVCLELMEEALALLNESPAFGSVLAFLTALPLHLAVTQLTDRCLECDPQYESFLASVFEFATTCLDVATQELISTLRQEDLGSPAFDHGLGFVVRMMGRFMSLLWHLPPDGRFYQQCPVQVCVSAASTALAELLRHNHVPGSSTAPVEALHQTSLDASALAAVPLYAHPRRSLSSSKSSTGKQLPNMVGRGCSDVQRALHEMWRTVQSENTTPSSLFRTAKFVAVALMDIAANIHLDVPADCFELQLQRDLRPLRDALIRTVAAPPSLYGDVNELPALMCGLVLKTLAAAPSPMVFARVQQEAINLDVVEVCIQMLRNFKDERRLTASLVTLRGVCCGNAPLIHQLASVVTDAVIQLLKTTVHVGVANAAFDLCSTLAFNTPVSVGAVVGQSVLDARRSPSKSQWVLGATTPPYCTARIHPGSTPFQERHLFRVDGGNVVNLCSFCAATHSDALVPASTTSDEVRPCGARLLEDVGVAGGHWYFACQCPCAESALFATQPPTVPLTMAQKLLASGKILSVMTQRLRTHGAAVANAVGRLSMQICCNEDVAQALFCSLVELPTLEHHTDAALAVAACQYFGQVRYLMTNYADTPIARYLKAPFEARRVEASPESAQGGTSTPQLASKSQPTHFTSSNDVSLEGLTPSPALRQPPQSLHSSLQLGASSSPPVVLFGSGRNVR